MKFSQTPYFHVAHASDLTGSDRVLYRLLEILPGFVSWGTIVLVVLLSWKAPIAAAFFIIAFDLYWLLKTFYLSLHQRHSWKRLLHNMQVDWQARVQPLKYEHLYHLVILPFYKESEETVEEACAALARSVYDKSRFIVVLASEERAGDEAQQIAERVRAKYESVFGIMLITTHPKDLPGEIKGKGPNITYAAEQTRDRIIRPRKIPYEDVIVSAFDIDTVVEPQYFLCLTWHFLTTEDPHHSSFQPVPLYNNNIWDVPAISRVAAFSSTLWQMIQQERGEKLTTFSSHAISFKALNEVGFWQKNMISDDSRIFWNLYVANDGNYKTVALAYPVSMDATLAPSTWQTLINIYRQQFRWLWGVENLPYMMFCFIKNKHIPLRKRLYHSMIQLEGWWSLATHPLMIFLLGWLPIVLGGDAFRDTVLSHNLPYITRDLMIVAMLGLVLAAAIAFSLMPRVPVTPPKRMARIAQALFLLTLLGSIGVMFGVIPGLTVDARLGALYLFGGLTVLLAFFSFLPNKQLRYVGATVQWLLIPFTITIFGAIPGLHTQARLTLGKYVGAFWVTPKHRKQATT